jgi:hypothetical protein
MTAPLPLAGWYPDPTGAPGQHCFDGKDRTEHRTGPPAPSRSLSTFSRRAFAISSRSIVRASENVGGLRRSGLCVFGGCTACVAATGHNSGPSSNSSSKPASQNVAAPSATSAQPSPPASPSGPVNEQYFLGDLRGETPSAYDGPWVPWPEDQTLMSQAMRSAPSRRRTEENQHPLKIRRAGSFNDGTQDLTEVANWLTAHTAELPTGQCDH